MDYYDFCIERKAEISAMLRERCEALREPITRYVADELAVLTAGDPETRAKLLKDYCCGRRKNNPSPSANPGTEVPGFFEKICKKRLTNTRDACIIKP